MTLAWVEDNYVDTSSDRIIDLEEFLQLRITDTEWAIEIALRRAHTTRVRPGPEWTTVRTPRRFTMEECERLFAQGRQVPLDLVPWTYWDQCDEFSLGKDF